ncbi:RidA family protein [Sphingobacterium sp. SG20118]|uniref:RidA family protein n=1 Tax=Sphingobacterium sp. SG20118 TaxID=3367156 RepID=UPI0037DFC804
MKKVIFVLLMSVFYFSVNAQEKIETKLPFSSSLKAGELLFVSGQVGINPATSKLSNASFEAEVQQVMENLKNELKKHNLTMDDLVSTIIYLKDMKQYDRLNSVYGSYFKNRFPTRTCIAVADLPAGASVEISGVAHFKAKQ